MMAFAQKTQEVKDPEGLFKQAELLYGLKNYQGARNMWEQYLLQPSVLEAKKHGITTDKARYYVAACAMELYQPDAEKLMLDFVNTSHETPYKRLAYYQLGRYYFRDRKYKDAVEWYTKVDIDDLDRDQRNEYYFQLAYCHFFNKEFKEALPLFAQTRDVSNKYYYPSNYYFGYISFTNGDYDKALSSFDKIKESSIYQKIIPYYISQIYFHRKQYQETVNYLKPLVDDNGQKYHYELNQLMGQAYFEMGKYKDALPYLEEYAGNNRSLRKEEAYQLGYCYYKNGNYDKAIERLQRLDNMEDTIGQSALFILGDCYLKTDNKTNARAAFMKASKLNWDSTIVESASFQYGKLCYESNLDNEAIRSLQDFVKTYSKSSNVPEARELLTDLFLNSNDYKQALEVIESIQDKSPKVKQAYQAVAYSRGIQVYNEGNYQEALRLFDISLSNPINPVIKALCYYWKGEAWNNLGEYQKASWQYPQFLTLATDNNIPDEQWLIITAYYGNGYSYLKRQMYSESATSLEKCVAEARKSSNGEVKNNILPDALLRLGDSYFMLKLYDKAANTYGEVVDKNGSGKEYAMYQKGFIQGLLENNQGKISTMLEVARQFPKGLYADDALFQAGAAYVEMHNTTAAINTFSRIPKEYPNSVYATKAYMRMGLIYYNQENWSKSNEMYNMVLDNYPNSEDAKLAFDNKKSIAVSAGDDKYTKDRQKFSSKYMNESDAEALSFDIANNQYMNNNFEQAAVKFSDYLQSYGSGPKALIAHYERGQSYYSTQKLDKALADFRYVLDNQPNDYVEDCALKAAKIAYETQKDYPAANGYFQQLLKSASKKENIFIANLGLMRTYYFMNDVANAATYANAILTTDQVPASYLPEANFYLGKQAFANKDYNAAADYFKKTSAATKNEMGVEAIYRLCQIESIKGNYAASNKMIYDNINSISAYWDWQARSYILLGDNYMGLNNYFQAKATYQSVLDNYDGSDTQIKKEAQDKLDKAKAADENKGKFKIDADTSKTLQEDPNLKLDLTAPQNGDNK